MATTTPVAIYHHSPLQHPIQFICFIFRVIWLWSGFSIFLLYAYWENFSVGFKKFKQESKVFKRNNHLRRPKIITIIKQVVRNNCRRKLRSIVQKIEPRNNDIVAI